MKCRIRLPKTDVKSRVSPLVQMYTCIVKRIGDKQGFLMNQSAVFVNKLTSAILEGREFKWYYDEVRNMSQKYAKRQFSWHWLNYSPSIDEDVRTGYAEVDTKRFWVKV